MFPENNCFHYPDGMRNTEVKKQTNSASMKNKTIQLFIFLFWISLPGMFAQQENLNIYTEKDLKTYPASRFTSIEIQNKHGDISVSAWNKNTIEVDMVITVNAEGKNSAEEILEKIKIHTSEKKEHLSFNTSFTDDFHSNHPFSIDYIVHLPAVKQLHLINRFGDINIASVTGNLRIDHEYGQLEHNGSGITDSIYSKLSFVDAQMGSFSNSNMELNNANITLQDVENGTFSGKYYQLEMQRAGKLEITTSTGRFNIGTVREINLQGDFCFASINKISGKGDLEITNGLLIIRSVTDKIRELSINNENAPVKLSLPDSLPYSLHGEVTNGQFRHYQPSKFRIIKEMEKTSFSGSNLEGRNGASIFIFNKNSGINIEK